MPDRLAKVISPLSRSNGKTEPLTVYALPARPLPRAGLSFAEPPRPAESAIHSKPRTGLTNHPISYHHTRQPTNRPVASPERTQSLCRAIAPASDPRSRCLIPLPLAPFVNFRRRLPHRPSEGRSRENHFAGRDDDRGVRLRRVDLNQPYHFFKPSPRFSVRPIPKQYLRFSV